MNRIMGVLKYILIYFGFKTIISYIMVRIIPLTDGNVTSIVSTSGLIAVFLTILFYRAESTDVVRHAPTKKLKLKYIVLIMITLGIVLYFYKKRKKVALSK